MAVVADLRTLLHYRGFQRLFTVRLISQCGDGMFQVGLATLYFFSPQNMTTAGAVAGAFAVLLLPFTVIGPFVGPLLDRWFRQRVLLIGNLVRAGLCLILALLIVQRAHIAAISVLALLTLGINRFLLSALSAGLPHVVPERHLMMANSITPTLGAFSTGVGAVLGFIVNRLTPEGTVRDAVTLVIAAFILQGASAAATRIGRTELGPSGDTVSTSTRASIWSQFRLVFVELAAGARYVARRGTPGHALILMALHRFLYGVNFIALLLISRNLLSDPADPDEGLTTFALLGGISLIGNFFAIVATPFAHERMSPQRWITVCLGMSLLSQAMLVATVQLPWIAIAGFLMGLGVQGAKIAVDTIVQRDTADRFRGRAFALYDMLYNAAFVGAAALAALVLPDTGWDRRAFVGLSLCYVALAFWYEWRTRAIGASPREIDI